METLPATRTGEGNLLLAALPPHEYGVCLQHTEPVTLPRKRVFYQQGETIETVYFLRNGVASLLAVMEDGATAEAATIGKEGFVGVPVVLGSQQSFRKVIMQVEGDALSMRADRLRELSNEFPALRQLLLSFAGALLNQALQIVACNRLHSAEQRMCRWLLLTRLQTGSEFHLTQEFLALMLGARRPTVTTIAGQLQSEGLIRYSRGQMEILDVEGLKRHSCECYRAIAELYVRLVQSGRL